MFLWVIEEVLIVSINTIRSYALYSVYILKGIDILLTFSYSVFMNNYDRDKSHTKLKANMKNIRKSRLGNDIVSLHSRYKDYNIKTQSLRKEFRSVGLMKRLYGLLLIFSVFIFSTNKYIVAGTWIEDFDSNLDSWTKREHQRERVIWQIRSKRLNIQTEPYCNVELNLNNELALMTHYTLDFTAFPIDTGQLQVKMRVISAKNANMGIFIGEKPESVFVNPLRRTYQFADHTIGGPLDFPIQNPHIELELKQIEVAFAHGFFQLFSEGERIVDFQDNNFRTITYLGIVVFPVRCTTESTVLIDDFVISGPSIPNDILHVTSKNKAAVVWGMLKQR